MGPFFVACVVAAGLVGAAAAQVTGRTYPNRPITIVVPAPPGGGADFIGRALAEGMRSSLGQPIVIDNVGGANGSIGTGKVARAAPDGYTLALGSWNTHVSNGALFKLTYDPVRDFEPVALLTDAGRLIVAHHSHASEDLRALVGWMSGAPERARFGTSGPGSMEHVAGLLLARHAQATVRVVHYRGVAPAMHELLGGQVDVMVTGVTEALPHLRARKLKAYAVTASSRFASAADIPTVDEAGMPGFYASVWTSLWAPRGTPTDIIARLTKSVQSALSDPVVRARFPEPAIIVTPERRIPEALRARQHTDVATWWPVIRAAGITASD